MYQRYYFALAVGATLLTAAWLFRPDERTTITSFGAFVSWSLTALVGGEVERVTSDGSVVAAPVPAEVRWLTFLFALLSLLALILYTVGVYPPNTDDEPLSDSQTNG
ncbi:uncharacterized protein NP_7020A (plasmid) [Natronomonas pharaonis DSM 2160]|uniref:Uncharacterized protein n=1 Tax=Natronomonas pharaonis (strain ATCC 35678 / DSM 2160 / CIP 103997 / JCM 8858 / NBRC 14720 / NCIMB 2260 / Gabara) TaxID=348780 RepID=Q3ILU4_NATPD|nr:hypothetical protein [Natronomonas pharaonis]CAI49739.1 uncharacterized protein NP_3296A [Natronomonas pharaonis DSM 2160]CAI50926.1 uncharacterized protein NP_7020A [Natronomonas pharaonis DSM 2160]